MRTRILSLLWITPFVMFIAGYYCAYRLVTPEVYEVPTVVGKSAYEALQLLSSARLHVSIVAQREDSVLPEGTVISQNPAPLQKIKPQQTVFLIVSQKPPVLPIPLFIGRKETEVDALARSHEVTIKKISIPHTAPRGVCVAQTPQQGTPAQGTPCLVYVSAGKDSRVIMPDCRGLSLTQVVNFFADRAISTELFHASSCNEDRCTCTIIDQRPLPGTCVDFSRGLCVQLQS